MKQQQQMIDKMGYDRSITMFSPDGRLLQVEYAKKTVHQGSTAIGLTCKEGVVFITDKRISSKLMVPEAIEKTFSVKVMKVNTLIKDGKKKAYVKFSPETPAIDIATNLGLM